MAGRLGVLAAVTGAWLVATELELVSPLILVSPIRTAETLIRYVQTEVFWTHFRVTLTEVAAAYSIAVAAGLTLGILLGSFRRVDAVFEPLVVGFYSLPSVVLYPLFFLVLGLGPLSKIAFGAVYALFPIAMNTIAGFRGVEPRFVTSAIAMGASRWQIATKVVMWAVLPSVLTGLRVGLNLSLTAVLAGEILASERGLGFLVRQFATTFETARLLSLVCVVLAGAALAHWGLSLLERRLAPWREAQFRWAG
jgi:NitT/TauT family transport system permease protein